MTNVVVNPTVINVLVEGDLEPTVIQIAGVGPQGAKGDQGDVGPVGPGVASGGDPGQILVKASATEFDTAWTSEPQADKIKFDVAASASLDAPGELAWDDLDQTLAFRTNGIEVDLAQENLVYVRNPAGESTIPKGAVVSVAGAAANRLQVALCSATVGGDGCRTLGVAITDITSPGFGFVSTFGLLRGFNTGNIEGTVTESAEVYVSATPGVLTTVEPEAPARKVLVGYVVTTGTQGSIFVTVRRSRRVQELDDVHAPSPSAGQVIRRNSGNTRYEAVTLGTAADAAVTDFATAAQGGLADSAIQPGDNVSTLTNDAGYIDAAGAPVQSVNTQTGAVVLDADDVGAVATTDPRVPPTPVGQADGRILVVDSDALVYGDSEDVVPSWVSTLGYPANIVAEDNFDRPDTTPAQGLGQSPQGLPWTNLRNEFFVSGKLAQMNSNSGADRPALAVLDLASVLGTRLALYGQVRSFDTSATIAYRHGAVILAEDANNHVVGELTTIGTGGRRFRIIKTVGGSVTTMAQIDLMASADRNPFRDLDVCVHFWVLEGSGDAVNIAAAIDYFGALGSRTLEVTITDPTEVALFKAMRKSGLFSDRTNNRFVSCLYRRLDR